jgi:hypothetical protein
MPGRNNRAETKEVERQERNKRVGAGFTEAGASKGFTRPATRMRVV